MRWVFVVVADYRPSMEPNPLLATLRDSVSGIVADECEVAVAYSGGLDSSVIAALASEKTEVMCYTCATGGSHDARNAKHCADEERRQLTLLELKPGEVRSFARRASHILNASDPVRIAYTIPILSVLHSCTERLVLTGSGADELFCGYAKYVHLRDPTRAMAADLEKMLFEAGLLSSEAAALGKIIESPYATTAVISAAKEIPLDRKINSTGRKIILREVAEILGLPSRNRPKKAAQYSSGVIKAMARLAKEEGLSLPRWTVKISAEGE